MIIARTAIKKLFTQYRKRNETKKLANALGKVDLQDYSNPENLKRNEIKSSDYGFVLVTIPATFISSLLISVESSSVITLSFTILNSGRYLGSIG